MAKTWSFEKYDACRQAKGLSHYRIAKDAGVSHALISMWKAGAFEPKYDKIAKIAERLNINIHDLLNEEDD